MKKNKKRKLGETQTQEPLLEKNKTVHEIVNLNSCKYFFL